MIHRETRTSDVTNYRRNTEYLTNDLVQPMITNHGRGLKRRTYFFSERSYTYNERTAKQQNNTNK